MPPGDGPASASALDRGVYELDAEIQVSHPDLLLSPTLSACPDVVFSVDFHASADASRPSAALFVTAVGDTDGVAATLDDDPTIEEATLVADFEAESLYRIRPVDSAHRLVPVFTEAGAVVRDKQGTRDGWSYHVYLPDRETLATLAAHCRDIDATLQVTRLSNLDAVTTPDRIVLTPSQRTLLRAAVERGYFDTPRRVSQRELAESFGVSPSAISQRLRTATRKLVSHALVIR